MIKNTVYFDYTVAKQARAKSVGSDVFGFRRLPGENNEVSTIKNREIILSKPENVLRTYTHADAVVSMCQRQSSVIIVALCGKMDFIFSDQTIRCDKAHAIFVPKGATYHIICHEYAESLLFNFQTNVTLPSAKSLGAVDHKNAEELFRKMDLLFAHSKHSRYMILAAYYELFSEIFDWKPPAETSEKYVDMAEQIMLRQFASDSLTCGDIAGQINISEVYLRKLFIRYRNISPSRYLFNIRMKKAKMYLAEGYSVGETAQNVGYRDIYQFSRAYKKFFGYPPSGTEKHPNRS